MTMSDWREQIKWAAEKIADKYGSDGDEACLILRMIATREMEKDDEQPNP
jgi:hypothetical protein